MSETIDWITVEHPGIAFIDEKGNVLARGRDVEATYREAIAKAPGCRLHLMGITIPELVRADARPHWEWGLCEHAGRPAAQCSKCGFCVTDRYMDQHERECWKPDQPSA